MQAKMGDRVLAEVVVDASPLASMVFLDRTEEGLPPSCLLVPSMHQIAVNGIINAGKDGR